MDKRKKFYSHNTNLLIPKPKSSLRHFKLLQGFQEFHRKYVLVPADKAANNIIVVCLLHIINTLKQELNDTKAYRRLLQMNRLPLKAIQMNCFISFL